MATNLKTASQFNTITNPYVDNFTSISGSDIVGVFGHVELLNLQGISVSVNREIHPIYIMGRVDPISFVRGKRGVAGSFIMVCNDRGALYDIKERYGVYAAKVGDGLPGSDAQALPRGGNALDESDRFGYVLTTPRYYDQFPPFDITLLGRNENIVATISRVLGVFIVSMGTGMSVDDNSIEQQCTFVALAYEDWRPAGRRATNSFETEELAVNPFFGPQGEGALQIDPTGANVGASVTFNDGLASFFNR